MLMVKNKKKRKKEKKKENTSFTFINDVEENKILHSAIIKSHQFCPACFQEGRTHF